jgi:predicted dehydrogenase
VSRTLAVAVIGAGQVAARHVEALVANPHAHVAAVVDPLEERAARLGASCAAPALGSYEELFATAELDAAVVCVPHDLHLPVARVAAAAGVHLLMEKPIANTLEEADAIAAAVEEAGVTLMMGFVHRFRTEVQAAHALVAEGAIGTVATALDRFCSLGGRHPPGWVWSREHAGGGVLMYGGIHAVDRLLWLLDDRVTSVAARAHDSWGQGDVEDGLVAMLDLERGTSAVLFENSPPYGRPGGWCTELFGTEGALRIQTGEWAELTSGSRSLTLQARDELHFHRQMQEFVSAVLEEREPSVPVVAGRDSLEVALAIYAAAGRRTPIALVS